MDLTAQRLLVTVRSREQCSGKEREHGGFLQGAAVQESRKGVVAERAAGSRQVFWRNG